MNRHLTYVAICALTLGLAGEAPAKKKSGAHPNAPAGTQQLEKLTGEWEGQVSFRVIGQPEIIARGGQDCHWVSKGWAVACEAQFIAPGLVYDEAILGGFDVASNQIQWAVVNSFGQALAMRGQFIDDDTMVLVKKSDVGGKPQVDTVTYNFVSQDEIYFTQQVVLDGTTITEVDGTIYRSKHR